MKRILVTIAVCGASAIVPAWAVAQSAGSGYDVVPNVPPPPAATPPAPGPGPTASQPTVAPESQVTPQSEVSPESEVTPQSDVSPESVQAPGSPRAVPIADTAPAPSRPVAAAAQESLPVTGRDLGLISVVGVLLFAAGIALRARTSGDERS